MKTFDECLLVLVVLFVLAAILIVVRVGLSEYSGRSYYKEPEYQRFQWQLK